MNSATSEETKETHGVLAFLPADGDPTDVA